MKFFTFIFCLVFTAFALATGNQPLHIAQDIERVNLLIDAGADVNARNEYGYSPLMLAVIENNPEKARVLLNAGADEDALIRLELYRIAIHIHRNKELAQVLVDAWIDMEVLRDAIKGDALNKTKPFDLDYAIEIDRDRNNTESSQIQFLFY